MSDVSTILMRQRDVALAEVALLKEQKKLLLSSLKWAATNISKPTNRLVGQNEQHCDNYDAMMAAIKLGSTP